MIAYKGFSADFTARYGSGRKEYCVGEIVREEKSKYAGCGMHCAEYVLDCLRWYPLGSGNRYCRVEAAGSIDEDGEVQISCTEMKVIQELTVRQIASAACMYMVQHPGRDWERNGNLLEVKKDKAEGTGPGSIAIARGSNPKVRGKAGSVLALVREERMGEFQAAKVFEVAGNILPDQWYTVTPEGKVEKTNEKKESFDGRACKDQEER